jgi:hypothetical protein
MAEVLSQEEIDQLLTAINSGATEPGPPFSIKEFEAYLKERQAPETHYGELFGRNIFVCRFFDPEGGAETLFPIILQKGERDGCSDIGQSLESPFPYSILSLMSSYFCADT